LKKNSYVASPRVTSFVGRANPTRILQAKRRAGLPALPPLPLGR